jgi:hypothetical protein
MQPLLQRYLRAATLLVTLGSAACVDRSPTLSGPGTHFAPSLTSASAAAARDSQRVALDQLTRAVALALGDPGLRQRVKNDMRNSPMSEHKLELRSYLNGESGGILLAKMARETGSSREAVLALLGAVRPLEFYMPVPAHRETWRGGGELLVASQIEDRGAPTAYTLSGQPVALSPHRAPANPVMVLTPVESNFSRPLDLSRHRNTRDQGGAAIGTYEVTSNCSPDALVECPDENGTGGGGGWAPKPRGLYMRTSYIPDTREGWMRGAPEIEYHIQGPNFVTDQSSSDLACSGETQSGYRRFNQDHPYYNGDVLLFTEAQIDNQRANVGQSTNHITVWEDDDNECSIKTDNQYEWLAAIAAFLAANATTAYVRDQMNCVECSVYVARGHLGLIMYYTASALQGNDDYIGLVIQKGTNPEYASIPTDWVITKSNAQDITGYAEIVRY